jgi:ribose transport system ATP-binding protein
VETPTPAVDIRNLTKTFPGQRALDNVSMKVRRGEIHGLLGENGSGKSTLIKVLSGFHTPDQGSTIFINGQPLGPGSAADSKRLGLRFVHQHLGIINEMTAVENVALQSGFNARPGFPIRLRAQAKRTQTLFARFGVEVDLWRPLGQCRAIDRTIVAIVRALDGLEDDGVLVLDEPTAALPPNEVDHLFDMVREVTRAGVTTIYVSHRLDEVFKLVDRVSVLRDGELQGTRDIDELDQRELVRLIVGTVPERYDRVSGAAAVAAPVRGTPVPERPPRLAVGGLRSATVKGVSFEVQAGEVLGIAGLIGSGREELAYALVGAVGSAVDDLRLDGSPVGGVPSPARAKSLGIGLVPGNRSDGSAIQLFDVRENITLTDLSRVSIAGRLIRGKELDATRRWLGELDIRPRDPARRFSLLSGGNQQKTILAKWFNIEPRVVLVDNPTAGVDVGARQAIYNLIRAKASEGVSFVICSSDHEDLVELCTRVLVMRDGSISAGLEGAEITFDNLLIGHAEESM